MIQHAAERVFRVVAFDRFFDRFADGDAEAAKTVRVFFKNAASGVGLIAGAGEHACAPRLHHQAAIRLLLVADFHHIHLAFHSEIIAGQR